jgi:hypothetical protein
MVYCLAELCVRWIKWPICLFYPPSEKINELEYYSQFFNTDYNKELTKVESPMREMYQEEPNKFLEIIVIRTLLVQEAKKQGFATSIWAMCPPILLNIRTAISAA